LRNRHELEQLVGDRLSTLPRIARIQSTLVLREVNRLTELPLGGPAPYAGTAP